MNFHDGKNSCGNLLLMAGGKHDKKGKADPLVSEFIKSLNLNAPRIAYVGAASNDDAYYYSFVKEMLSASGAGEVFLTKFNRKSRGGNNIQDADIVFISGGDVKNGMDNIAKANAIDTIIGLFRKGISVIGVSAGSIMMGKAWVEWAEPDDDSAAGLFPCLGLTDFICDTHDENDDWSELKTAVALSPDGTLGYGIPSGSAISVAPNGLRIAYDHSINIFQNKSGISCQLAALKPSEP